VWPRAFVSESSEGELPETLKKKASLVLTKPHVSMSARRTVGGSRLTYRKVVDREKRELVVGKEADFQSSNRIRTTNRSGKAANPR